MAGFYPFSPSPCGALREPPPWAEPEPLVGPWLHAHSSLAPRPRRRRCQVSPRESHSLTHVARRPAERATKHRAGCRRPDDPWGPAWWHQPAARGASPPTCPDGAYSPQSGGTYKREKRWAVPVSPSSVLTDRSAPCRALRTRSACACTAPLDGCERAESLGSRCSPPSVSCRDAESQHVQVLKSRLEEAVTSSRDQKIVAAVLTRLQKAQRMRELQRQAAVAWEELKRSDRQVQLTLEHERRRLLQQSQEQWRRQKERRRPHPGPRRETRDAPDPEDPRLQALERARAEAERRRQRQVQRLREQQRVLQSLGELNSLQLRKRLEEAWHQRHPRAAGAPAAQGNLSSLVNVQARKVLMDCQAKAEELLRELSLEHSPQGSPEAQQGPSHQRPPQLREEAARAEGQLQQGPWHAREAEEQKQVRRRLLAGLAEQKVLQTRDPAQGTPRDRAPHLREASVLREKNHPILKLKAEKDDKCHMQGIKEAVRKKEQRTEQASPGKDPAFQNFQKACRASRRDKGEALPNSCFGQMAAEAQLRTHQQRGGS